MSDDSFSDELLDLQRRYDATAAAAVEFADTTDAKHGRVWPEEDRVKLERLREEQREARRVLWAHPEHEAARTSGRWGALKAAAGSPGWKPKP